MEVLALPSYVLVTASQQHHRLPPAMAPLLATGDAPLGAFEVQFRHAKDAWVGDLAPIRECGERL